MNKIFIDFETRSRINIKETGSWIYSTDNSTDVLCVAYAINDEPVKIIPFVVADFNIYSNLDLKEFKDLCSNGENTFIAHNATFEQNIYKNIFVKRFNFPEIPHNRWLCTMAQCLVHNIPASLKKAALFLKLDVTKDMYGATAMLQLTKPNIKNEWISNFEIYEKLYEYCKTDVEVTRKIFNILPKIPSFEQKVWELDQKINTYGFKCDTELIQKSIDVISKFETQINSELKQVSNGHIESYSTLNAFKRYFQNILQFPIETINKQSVKSILANPKTPEIVKKVLDLRLAVGKTSIKKYLTFDRASDDKYIMRNTLQYHAASTGRWGGRLVQVQNLPRGKFKISEEAIQEFKNLSYDDLFKKYGYELLEFLSSNLRGCIISRENKTLIWSDYNAIETRVLAWLTDEIKMLDIYTNGGDIYCDMASAIYGKYISKEDKNERQMGKQAILGCGYGMGGSKFMATCANYDMDIPEDFAIKVVNIYRRNYPKIPVFWSQIQKDVFAAIINKKKLIKREKYSLFCTETFLFLQLPSGRYLSYYNPRVEGQEIKYTGINSQTKKEESIKLYGGRITENIVQAIARDILVNAMFNLEEKGFKIIFSVHDEIIAEANSELEVIDFETCMLKQPEWAKNIPLAVETTCKKRYEK